MPPSDIVIKGAREHNLQDLDLVLPRNELVCFTGVSGSGKSSLAFDTLYAEGQRRYVESLSSFARQFLGQLPKPDVDLISGLSPSISISQKSAGKNPRSTVGTMTEIHDYLRVLYARVGRSYCPRCAQPISAQTREQIIAQIMQRPEGSRILILAPLARQQKGEYRDLFADLLKQGFVRARVDGRIVSLTDQLRLDRQMRHDIDVVVDRLVIRPSHRTRLSEAVELALQMGKGTLVVQEGDAAPGNPEPRSSDNRPSSPNDVIYSVDYACTACGVSFQPLTPQTFSFNSPQGMCLECDGLGEKYTFDPELLVPDPSLSFKQGCFELFGRWKSLGRWRRHIYQGVADTVERLRDLPRGTMLETAWCDLPRELQDVWLWGTGDEHVTFTWRGGKSPLKYGGTYEGIIPKLLTKYRNTRSFPQRRRLERYMRKMRCPACRGRRLNEQACSVRIASNHTDFQSRRERSLPEVCELPVAEAMRFFSDLDLNETQQLIAQEALKEVCGRLQFLVNVGLDYLTLDRTAPTLSGGESQRIRLAGQIGAGLVGVLYILDEPSIGLHPRDNRRLLDTLQRLRDQGNTVVVVEHDEDTMRAADRIVDFGPGPGIRGGRIVECGTLADVKKNPESITGQYLSGKDHIETPPERRAGNGQRLTVVGAAHNNLKHIDVGIPLGCFVCVTGVSGSGKSSLVSDILVEALRRDLNGGDGHPGRHERIEGLDHLDKMIAIDQSPIGRTPRSNPGTYIKVFDDIRKLFAQLPESRRRGYQPGRFSFNVRGGRCEACEGNGSNRLEMDFLADIWVTCPVCQGHRYNRETLDVRFKEKSIADVLEMDVQQLLELFENIPPVRHKLQTLHDVGLDYLKLGQPSPTLSGGEAQRIKLARELVKKSTGRTLYLLDEPTTGLHFADIKLLLRVLHSFVDAGNTVLVVEHNLDVIKTADWIIDLGPEGGEAGGHIVAEGTPEDIVGEGHSHTGKALAELFARDGRMARSARRNGRKRKSSNARHSKRLQVRGARQHNLRDVDVDVARDQMTVFCGPSGSGKSSLAMDTIYAEGQRRYVESLSAYARQFVSQMQKPQLEHIEGLSPAIAIEQKNLGHTPRSTVGTVTEIYDYLRVLMARLGQPHCPDCDIPIGTQTADEIIEKLWSHPPGDQWYLMAPLEWDGTQNLDALREELRAAGFARIRVDGTTHRIDDVDHLDRRRRHELAVVVDRVKSATVSRRRIADSVETALALGKGVIHVAVVSSAIPEPHWEVNVHSQHLACGQCGRSFETLTPHHFSFNSYLGWCPACEGLGVERGANLSALVTDAKRTLREGALRLWPDVAQARSLAMLEALSRATAIPLDVPFEELASRHRRLLLHGTGDRWFVTADESIHFQFKGLYPALEEAARLSPSFRAKLEPFIDEVDCSACGGSRLRDDAGAVRFRGQTIDQLCRLPLGKLRRVITGWKLSARERRIAGELMREIRNRVQFLNDVGLDYLTLARGAATLSNGEAQRIRLASQLGSGLCGVLYVLDEPTIGLHPRDNTRLLRALHKLRDLGNTLIVVEHDREVIEGADHVCDFGPGAGRLGGRIVAKGTPRELERRRASVTGPYLSGRKAIPVPANRRMPSGVGTDRSHEAWKRGQWLEIIGARHNNLKNIDVAIPLGTLTAVTGPSGSGKSSLIDDILYSQLARTLHRAATVPGLHDELRGVEEINKVIRVDQQPLGNSPTSNPATYTGAFDLIRTLYAKLPQAKLRGYSPRRFSFNCVGGRCEACEGSGYRRIEMHFLPDVWVKCETCGGRRYNEETLAITYHGRSINDVLEMTCGEAVKLFENISKIRRILETLCAVGLDYLTLGQPAPTLSGGEAQRVKLAAELARPDTGRTLYLLDEPTTGLHFDDLAKLLDVMHRLVDLGNTVVVIEHNLDVIKSADWVIDLGPEAGEGGGQLVVAGTPEDLVEYARRQRASGNGAKRRSSSLVPSHTAIALEPVLAAGPIQDRETAPADMAAPAEDQLDLENVGDEVSMPWEVDGRRWHTQDRVDRKGNPCRWDGRILERVVDRIHELGDFSETNWNARSVVEIAASRKSDGWFFHAITGETWMLKMKFRVYRGTFKREELLRRLPLKTLNQMDDLPIYGNEPRVKCRSVRGPWQEVEIRAHTLEEIDTPEFWKFVEQAVQGFFRFTDRPATNLEDHMPWKKLGRKWHFLRKGFPPGKKIRWPVELLEELCEILHDVAPDAQMLWNNQQVVRVYLPGCRDPWASLLTKRPERLTLVLQGPKNEIAMGQIADIGREPELDGTRPEYDVIKLSFVETEDLYRSDLVGLLKDHASRCRQRAGT